MVSRNTANKGFKTVKLQTPVHTQSTNSAFRNVFFFPLYDVVLLGNQMQINITLLWERWRRRTLSHSLK